MIYSLVTIVMNLENVYLIEPQRQIFILFI